jgi:hypothetical protein
MGDMPLLKMTSLLLSSSSTTRTLQDCRYELCVFLHALCGPR